jgi:hypothetical protein
METALTSFFLVWVFLWVGAQRWWLIWQVVWWW